MARRRVFQTIDCHAAGEPLRIITGGLPRIPGETILERRRYLREHMDEVRRILMWEPRGHADMYGCVLTPPVTPGAHHGVLFMHNEGYSTMCGHGIVGLVTVLLETGMMAPREPVTTVVLDTPAGRVEARARVDGDRVRSVTFENVPSFLYASAEAATRSHGRFPVRVAFGGAFYVMVEASEAGLEVTPQNLRRLVAASEEIKRAVGEVLEVVHPLEPELHGLYGVVYSGPPLRRGAHRTGLTVFADAEVDRSPCGTCTSAKMAELHARGELALGEEFVNESLLGTRFIGRLTGATTVGRFPAVIPEVTGSAHITGFHTFVVDPEDPLAEGFLLR